MVSLFFILFIGLELKHYVADYFLQPGWMLAGKGDLSQMGGYVHAAVHAAMSAIVLFMAQTPLWLLLLLVAAEWVVHFGLDFAKIHYSRGVHVDTDPSRFWGLHGFDQLTHQLTYGAMIFAVFAARGLV